VTINTRVVLSDGGLAHIPGLARPIAREGSNLADDDAGELRQICRAALAATTRSAEYAGLRIRRDGIAARGAQSH